MAQQEINDMMPGILLMKERIAELEAELAKSKTYCSSCADWEGRMLDASNEVDRLEADNTRLRGALEKTKASLLKYLRNTDAIIYTEAAALVLEIARALAPQPAKEGE